MVQSMAKMNAPRATAAWYDGTTRRVVMELGTGYRVGIPLARLSEIAGATPSELGSVEILGRGNTLHWETLDADYSVPALVLDRNGRKGGRPKR